MGGLGGQFFGVLEDTTEVLARVPALWRLHKAVRNEAIRMELIDNKV